MPCALLIDLMMPKMDGWQLIDALGQDPVLARIPSAVVSAARDSTRLAQGDDPFPQAVQPGRSAAASCTRLVLTHAA